MSNFIIDFGRRKSIRLEYPCQSQTTCFPFETTLQRGKYFIETWGAQGGDSNSYKGGKGAYACGTLTIRRPTKAYIYIGAKGTNASGIGKSSPAAFNGGGSGFTGTTSDSYASSGGGGTDVRIDTDDIKRRVIVAAGGGGTGYYKNAKLGGAGGDEHGLDAAADPQGTAGKGADQFSKCPINGASDESDLGRGSNKLKNDGCGGGGGFIGGGAGSMWLTGGGGGSSFVFTKQSASNPHVNLETNYLLKDAFLVSGINSFPSFASYLNETGHEGNGCAVLTKSDLSYCSCKKANNLALALQMMCLMMTK